MAIIEENRIGQTEVILDPTDEGFKLLVAALNGKPGLYWMEHGRSLKVGLSKTGIGNRLADHVRKTYADRPRHRKDFPAWHCFMRALIGRTVTIRWQVCPPAEVGRLHKIESAAIAAADPLWERMKHENEFLKAEPERQPDFTARVARIIDGWQS